MNRRRNSLDSRKLDLEKENRWIVDALFATRIIQEIEKKKKKKKMIRFKI